MEDKVCLLKKGLYGLKQGQRTWNKKLDQALCDLGFSCGPERADTCVYVKHDQHGPIILIVYVDDIVVASSSLDSLDSIKRELMKRFDIRDLGELKYFLGLHIERQPDGGYFVHQRKHCDDILEYFGMAECNPAQTPMETKVKLAKRTPDEPACDQRLYRKGIGALLYLLNTRPDLAFPVGVLSRFLDDPSAQHWAAFKRLLRYLRGTTGHGLLYSGSGSVQLQGWADADWCGDQDDRRSTSGYLVSINGTPVSWSSKKQSGSPALSSTEAEYVSLTRLCQEVLWLRQLLSDLGHPQSSPTTLYGDNQGALKTACNPTSRHSMKHVDVKHHFIRHAADTNLVSLQHVPTADNPADILTKSLGTTKYQTLKAVVGVISNPLSIDTK